MCVITIASWTIVAADAGDANPVLLAVAGVVEDVGVSPPVNGRGPAPTTMITPAAPAPLETAQELPQTPAALISPALVEVTPTVPVTTVPVATVPVATVPVTTVPATTVPATTVPATTVPATTLAPTTTSVPPALETGSIAAAFVADLNRLRSSHGLPALARDGGLDALAQPWAQTMATNGSLRHSELIYQVIDGSWNTAGENIAYGPTEASIFAGLEGSEGHLANMVSAGYTHVGIGVMVMGDVIWTAHLFAG